MASDWGPNRNILWKTPIEGYGISSPIVWEDKVFVTTAVEGTRTLVSRWVIVALCSVLMLLGLAVAVFGKPTLPLTADKALAAAAAGVFMVGISFQLHPAISPSEALGVLSQLIKVPPGNVLHTWLLSGIVGGAAATVAVACTMPTSKWRLAGSAALALGALALFWLTPRDQHTQVVPAAVRLLVTGPLLLTSAWFGVSHLLARRRSLSERSSGMAAAVLASTIVTAALLSVAYSSFLQPRAGLWRAVICLSLESGEIRWQRNVFMAPVGRKFEHNSYATPTPVTDGEHLFSHFGSGMVMMDLEGSVKWTKRLPEYDEYLRYGAGSSPVMSEDLVIYTFMAETSPGQEGVWSGEHSYLVGVEKETGRVAWRASPLPGGHDSYSTPLLVADRGAAAVVFSSYEMVLAYEAETGQPLWSAQLPLAHPVPSVVADSDHVYVSGGLYGPRVVAAIRRGGSGDVTGSHVIWALTKGTPGTSSPILYDDLLYWVTDQGVVYCVDPRTGQLIWRERLKGQHWASPVASEGKIYFASVQGNVSVIRAGREFEVLAENRIGERILASPAIAGGRLLVRGAEHLFCIVEELSRDPIAEEAVRDQT